MIVSGQSRKRERMVWGGRWGNAVRMTSVSTRAHDLGMESLCLSWPPYGGLWLKACVKTWDAADIVLHVPGKLFRERLNESKLLMRIKALWACSCQINTVTPLDQRPLRIHPANRKRINKTRQNIVRGGKNSLGKTLFAIIKSPQHSVKAVTVWITL